MGTWRAPTRRELMARFRPGDHAEIIDSILDLSDRGARHQPRLPGGTRVRVIEETGVPDLDDPLYRVEILEPSGRPTRYWAITAGSNLTEAPDLPLWDWLRSLRY